MKFHVVFEKQELGYTAYVVELPGCISQGDTLEETKENINEAMTLYLEELNDKETKNLFSSISILEKELVI